MPSSDVGTSFDLTGKWMFKPAGSDKEVAVPVPQMLSRVQWWLDDSEDFKKWEQARLDALGFDTERTDEGTYRATIELPTDFPKDRHLWIEFDGVAMQCKTSINGQLLGEHKGMFSRFGYDLTPHLKPGKNELTVWVSMEKIPKTTGNLGEAVTVNLSAAKVISMSKGMFGPLTPNQDNRAYDLYGIWQPAKLVVRGAARIEDVWFRSTPDLKGADIDVEISPVDQPVTGAVRCRISDPDDPKISYTLTTVGTVKDQSEARKLRERGAVIETARLIRGRDLKVTPWTPASPKLYRLDVTIESLDGKLVDIWTGRVGFRNFEIKKNKLFLNGHPYFLRGANQLPYGKNPWDPQLARHLIKLLHDGNIRFTRTHATPWNEAWLDAADEIGLAVSIEGIRPWAFAGKAADGKTTIMPPTQIFQHWLMENEDVVKRCRNHPSVFIFTVGNEMLLRDAKNLDKWKLLSDVTKQTRSLAPNHPIVCSSDYTRDPEFYESTLKPPGFDDGDIDDMHRYNGWYADSTFVVDSRFEKEAKTNQGKRPLIGQEMATGYPDLDTGLPVLRYTRDLLTPQAWVGNLAYPGNDPAPWLAHHAAVTKRWAESLRSQRGNTTSGFGLFSAECWFRHSYLPEATPYPVYEAVKQAYEPIGVAIETTQRRFYSGDTIETNVYLTNDDEQFRDLAGLKLIATIGRVSSVSQTLADVAELKYYATVKVPVKIKLPQVDARKKTEMLVMLKTADGGPVSATTDPIEIFPRLAVAPAATNPKVIFIQKGEPLAGFADQQPLRQQVESGATAILFSPSKQIVELFPNDLLDVKSDVAEFADFAPCAGTKLVETLQPLDLKWWARKDDWRAFIATTSHRLKPGGKARELIRYIPAHSYIAKEKVPDQYRCVMSEVPSGKGRIWICDVDLAASAEVDPIARIFADNLSRAAADPESTKTLPKVPSHEELLAGKK